MNATYLTFVFNDSVGFRLVGGNSGPFARYSVLRVSLSHLSPVVQEQVLGSNVDDLWRLPSLVFTGILFRLDQIHLESHGVGDGVFVSFCDYQSM